MKNYTTTQNKQKPPKASKGDLKQAKRRPKTYQKHTKTTKNKPKQAKKLAN